MQEEIVIKVQQVLLKFNLQVDKLETKEILEIYPTVALASRENHCDSSAICKVCTGKRKKCGGYGWKYIERKENIDE